MTPKQKPHRSVQEVCTLRELLAAISREFSVQAWARDLAANVDNTVASIREQFYGPGSTLSEDALTAEWPVDGDLWLNPPFGEMEAFVAKCANQGKRFGRIFVLMPAATGANWYLRHVWNRAHVVQLTPRVTFVGHASPYPKDLLLAIYSDVRGGVSAWRWK